MIPIQCEYYALEGVTQLMSNIQRVKANVNGGLDVEGVILTMYDGPHEPICRRGFARQGPFRRAGLSHSDPSHGAPF